MRRSNIDKYRALNRSLCFALVLVAGMCLAACRSGTSVLAVTGSSSPPAPSSLPASQATTMVLGSGPLHVTITSPVDESVVAVPQVDVAGQAPPDTVITINDTIVVVGATGQFSATVPLQDGPNELDVLASDPDGNEVSATLFVTYESSG
jgi:hypothetical protein